MKICRLLSLPKFFTLIAAAAVFMPLDANSQVSGPNLGYVFVPNMGIQPIFGIPGSSHLGQGLEVPHDYSKVIFSPMQDYALVVTSSLDPSGVNDALPAAPSYQLQMLDLRGFYGLKSLTIVHGELKEIIVSPSGSAAALFNVDGTVQVFRGLPDTVSTETITTHFSPENLTASAINDDGTSLLVASWDGKAGSVFSVATLDWSILGDVGYVSAIAFVRRSNNFYFLDKSNNQASEVRDWSRPTVVATADDGLNGPTTLAVLKDHRLLIATTGTEAVAIIDLAHNTKRSINCACRISGLDAMSEAGVFRLTIPEDGPIVLLDASVYDPRTYFIPISRN
jgi:hypothetical protein